MANRRDFLKLMGTALGGTMLAACGTTPTPPGGASDAPPLPNGFRFFKLKDSSAALPGGLSTDNLRMDAMIHNGAEIVYSALDTQGGVGLYAVSFDSSGNEPRVTSERRVIRTGERLNGRPVLGLGSYDMNASGQIALVVKTENEYLINTVGDDGKPDGKQKPMTVQMVYLERGRGWERLLDEHSKTEEGHEFAGIYHDIDLHDDGNVVFVADYVHNFGVGQSESRNGVFYAPKGTARTQLVVHSGQRLTQSLSSSAVSRFGLVDLHDRGQFVVQGAINPLRASDQADKAPPESVLLRGNLGQISTQGVGGGRISALSVSSASSGSGLRAQSARAEGLSLMGARSGPRGAVAQVLHTTPSTQSFVLNGQQVAKTGDLSPMGEEILTFVSPVMSPGGEIYFTVYTEAGFELCAHNGRETRTVLRTGDRLANDPRPIGSIHFGNLTNQIDGAGRLAFVVTHQDASSSASVVLGLPV